MPTLNRTWNEFVDFLEQLEPAKITIEVEDPIEDDEPDDEPDEGQDDTF